MKSKIILTELKYPCLMRGRGVRSLIILFYEKDNGIIVNCNTIEDIGRKVEKINMIDFVYEKDLTVILAKHKHRLVYWSSNVVLLSNREYNTRFTNGIVVYSSDAMYPLGSITGVSLEVWRPFHDTIILSNE